MLLLFDEVLARRGSSGYGGRLDCSSTPIRRFVVAMAVAVEHEGDKSAANHERKDDAQYHGDVPVDAYLNVN